MGNQYYKFDIFGSLSHHQIKYKSQ